MRSVYNSFTNDTYRGFLGIPEIRTKLFLENFELRSNLGHINFVMMITSYKLQDISQMIWVRECAVGLSG